MYLCDGKDHWCCDQGNVYHGCCSDPRQDLGLGQGIPTMSFETTPPAVASTTSSSSVIPSATAPTTTAMASPESSSPAATSSPPTAAPAWSKDLDLKVGAGVGVPLGIGLLLALVYIITLKKQQSRYKALSKVQLPWQQHDKPRSGSDGPYQRHIEVSGLEHEARAQPELHAHSRGLPQLPDLA